MLKLYICGYLNRVQLSRRLEREAGRNLEAMWLTGRLSPDHKTIADFRKDDGPAIKKVCAQFVELCRKMGPPDCTVSGRWTTTGRPSSIQFGFKRANVRVEPAATVMTSPDATPDYSARNGSAGNANSPDMPKLRTGRLGAARVIVRFKPSGTFHLKTPSEERGRQA
jgi:hypothetical protein